ncbi:MAG: ketoacyl-ACP synthase III [Myxococcaceae bacterium]|nr:ketoacyl-ACP synthase III [Myxococcaceae bacterium]
MRVVLKRVAFAVPDRVVTNDELIAARGLKMKASWIAKHLGAVERRWAAEGEAASDLGVRAVRALGLERFQGALFVSTVSPDHLTPSTASILKRKLGLTDAFPALDVSAACAGALFALEQARFRLECTGEAEALVVATEVRSRFVNPDDRRTVFLFGDGACAFHLTREERSDVGLEWTVTRTVASASVDILVPGGGSAAPLDAQALARGDQFIRMLDGPNIVELTLTTLVDAVKGELSARAIPVERIDHLFLHQGNAAICEAVAGRLGIPPERTWSNFGRFGNTSSASVGLCLAEAAAAGKLSRGQRVLLVAMGAGNHLGMVCLTWA